MSRLHFVIPLLCITLTAFGQDFRTPWIACPNLDGGQQAWFREVVELEEEPARVWLSVTTTGYVDVYVNERNISTSTRMPYREADDVDNALALCFDVTRFFGKGRNVIGIHYSPISSSPKQPNAQTNRQVAAHLWGAYTDGSPFALTTDDDWLCRPANGSMDKNGEEHIDNRGFPRRWKAGDTEQSLWRPVVASPTSFDVNDYEEAEGLSPAEHITRTLEPAYIQNTPDKTYAIFKEAFNGWVRVTLRKCKPGQHILIDNMEYTCSGEFDEQACARFTVSPHRIVVIKGDKDFQPEQIFSIEGLDITPTFSDYYWP